MSAPDDTLIIVVLYRGSKEDDARPAGEEDPLRSRTLQCLAAVYAEQPEVLARYRVLVWDNSPKRWHEPELSFPFTYRHAAAEGLPNDGVSGAYNAALRICNREGLSWMLLLDQDTEVNAAYLAGMSRHRLEVESDARIAAVAPLLFEGDLQLSPQQVLRHRHKSSSPEPSRILEEDSFAANSGVLMRASSLTAVGGYSEDFWLDYSDIEVFHRLYAKGGRIFLASDLRLQHSMTMLDYDGRMTPERYGNFLAAEQAFFDLYRDRLQNGVQALRLAARVWRQRRYRNPVFSQMTRQSLLRRISTSKAARLEQWRRRRAERQAAVAGA